ncbi:hypothetical protein R3W88_000849 [Solanum pinnatisectum]|uniref:Uncharacterized protein n=1 Tax=Solanum pinnatisectum TaxID=50273 RepID=A0AAV9MGJ1_9SOLN|nr:hypothetical protein R3W88_000849 [Solanum pinnatisectum]
MPWMIGGDFNGVLSAKEKIGRLPVYFQEYEDFAFCINSYCIFKRIDKYFMNQALHDMFGKVDMQNLARTRADHAPLFITCGGLD